MVAVHQIWSPIPLAHMIHRLGFSGVWEVAVVLDLIQMKHVPLKVLCYWYWYEHISQHPVMVVGLQIEGAIQAVLVASLRLSKILLSHIADLLTGGPLGGEGSLGGVGSLCTGSTFPDLRAGGGAGGAALPLPARIF